MSKKYEHLVINMDKSKNLDLSKLSLLEKKSLEKRDIIYIYYGDKNIYVGQTINFQNRHLNHLNNGKLKNYNKVVIIYGKYIDKNLDYLEKQLITLFVTDNSSGSNKRKVDNISPGISTNHIQDTKILDSYVIRLLWENELYNLGIVRNKNVSYLKKKILARYSPFLELNKWQQCIIDDILSNDRNGLFYNYLIEGGSGTGKTVMMTNIVAQIFDEFNGAKKIGVVVKANWRKNAKDIFKSYEINNNLVVGTWGNIKESKDNFDYIIVDESHRLPYFYGKLHPSERKYFNGNSDKNSLELLGEKTKSLVLLYDKDQSIRPSDIPRPDFESYIINNNFQRYELTTQFRIDVYDKNKNYTADDYIKGIKYILQLSEDDNFDKSLFRNPDKDSYFGIVDSIKDLFDYIERMDNLIPDSENRVIAGYAREWVSRNSHEYDWIEGNYGWIWNSTHENWMNRENSRYEIGSIHAVQGVDINCVGVIIGSDLSYNDGKVIAIKDNYYDRNGVPIKAEYNEYDFTEYVKNIYYVLLTRGIDGVRVYIEDDDLKEYVLGIINS